MRETHNRRVVKQGASVVLSMALATALAPNVTPMLAMDEEAKEVQRVEDEDAEEVESSEESSDEASQDGDSENGGFKGKALQAGVSTTDDSKVEDSQAGDSKADDSLADDAQVEDSQASDPKNEDSQNADSLAEDSKTDESQSEGHAGDGYRESERVASQEAEAEIAPAAGAGVAPEPSSIEPRANEVLFQTQSESGCVSTRKLTLAEQRAALNALPAHPTADEMWSVLPNVSAYTPGTLSSKAQTYAREYINLMRRIAGVNGITFTDNLNVSAAEGALLLARIDQLTHEPSIPSEVSGPRAEAGRYACEKSTLGGLPTRNALGELLEAVIKGQMADNLTMNIERCGHRRRLLDPSTLTMGIGAATSASDMNYVAIRNYGDGIERTPASFDFIAWPPSGYLLSELFPAGNPWTIGLNSQGYEAPSLNAVRVNLTRVSDGRSWTFDARDNSMTLENEFFNIVTKLDGLDNWIIFNPGKVGLGADAYTGEYRVDVTGLMTSQGQPTSLSYSVMFGESGDAAEKEEKPEGKAVSVSNLDQLQAALEASDVGEIAFTEDITLITSKLSVSHSVIIDLNNYRLSFDGSGDLTVTGGTVTVKNGFVFSHSKELADGEPLKVTGGTLNITGGADVMSYYVGAVAVSGSGTLKVSDASLDGGSERYALVGASVSGKVEMSDVELKPNDGAACVSTTGSATATMKFAKIFTSDPQGVSEYIPDGYKLSKSSVVDIYYVQGDLSSSRASVTVYPKSVEYDGTRKEPTVTVAFDGKDVTSKCRVTYENNRDIGTATVRVEPYATSDTLTGSTSATFQIVKAGSSGSSSSDKTILTSQNLSNATLSLSNSSFTYSGSEHKPTVTVALDGKTVASSNYDVTYNNNRDAGTATVMVTAKSTSDYYGTASTNFTISRKEAQVTAKSVSKKAGEPDPTFTATVTGTVGSDKVEYTLSRQSGESAGSYTITPSGSEEQGNYRVTFKTGTLTISGSSSNDSSTKTNTTTSKSTQTDSSTHAGASPATATAATPSVNTTSSPSAANTSVTQTPVTNVAPTPRAKTATQSSVTPGTGDASTATHLVAFLTGGIATVSGLVARMRARRRP